MSVDCTKFNSVFNHKLHKRMWLWLAKNPRKRKEDWFERCGIEDVPIFECYACKYAIDILYELDAIHECRCTYCPLQRAGTEYDCLNGLFNTWRWSLFPSRRVRKARIKAARKIAKLQVEKWVKTI